MDCFTRTTAVQGQIPWTVSRVLQLYKVRYHGLFHAYYSCTRSDVANIKRSALSDPYLVQGRHLVQDDPVDPRVDLIEGRHDPLGRYLVMMYVGMKGNVM